MTDFLAHSARKGTPPQTYRSHTQGVLARAMQYAREAGRYASEACVILAAVVGYAAETHDLGKLDDENQATLRQSDVKGHLPVHHQDAGAAWLVRVDALLSAYLVKYHHRGLCDIVEESSEDRPYCRDEDAVTRERTDQTLAELVNRHNLTGSLPGRFPQREVPGDLPVFLRVALSCLADADHTDTARHYRQYPDRETMPDLRADARLIRLNDCMAALSSAREDGRIDETRQALRKEMYADCRDSDSAGGFSACDSPVGSGKTTAVMAHLLKQAKRRNARHVFVVLPYTSIIAQSVAVYRKCLTLPGENPESVVAELHFRADFQDMDTRCLTALWRSPIIVTTAVAFFETLASNRPSALRRLHELPGSVVFIDEAHAALPARLLPVAWHWMNVLEKEWGCYWVLGSGSLARFWELEGFEKGYSSVTELVNENLRMRLMAYERNRVTFRWMPIPKSRSEMVAWVSLHSGPRLLIVNTVQSAAVLAEDFRTTFGIERVEHLSTALTPEDRERSITRVTARLKDKTDTDWTLVATSCVEAGVNFSFRIGFREIASLMSLLQIAGRVNREGEELYAEVWSFTLQDDPMLTQNRGLNASIAVLDRYLREGDEIVPALCTRALIDELNENDSKQLKAGELLRDELNCAFQTIANEFVVIDTDTVVIIPDDDMAKQIRCGQSDWQTIQRRGINVPRTRACKLRLEELATDIFKWDREYDDFIGYMAGIVRK